MFVNSDAFVQEPGSVDLLLSALDDPTVGLAVPRLLNQDLTLQPSVVPISTPLPELVRASGLSRFMPDALQPRLGTYWNHGSSRDVQAADGAVILIRGRTWDELGGFDESLYMYAEDHELFGRAADRGWRTRFVAGAVFVHLGGASASRRWDPPGPRGADRPRRGPGDPSAAGTVSQSPHAVLDGGRRRAALGLSPRARRPGSGRRSGRLVSRLRVALVRLVRVTHGCGQALAKPTTPATPETIPATEISSPTAAFGSTHDRTCSAAQLRRPRSPSARRSIRGRRGVACLA